jgi:hypothetical protein
LSHFYSLLNLFKQIKKRSQIHTGLIPVAHYGYCVTYSPLRGAKDTRRKHLDTLERVSPKGASSTLPSTKKELEIDPMGVAVDHSRSLVLCSLLHETNDPPNPEGVR